jgi:hypothetical protein
MANEKRTEGGRASPVTPGARCVAPIDDDQPEPRLCGEPATTTRIVEELVCPLCEAHATELDEEHADAHAESDVTAA